LRNQLAFLELFSRNIDIVYSTFISSTGRRSAPHPFRLRLHGCSFAHSASPSPAPALHSFPGSGFCSMPARSSGLRCPLRSGPAPPMLS